MQYDMHIEHAMAKIELLKTLLSQQGDTVLTEQDKYGLVCILEEILACVMSCE